MNCWEYTKCGREPGGENQEKFGICPATVSKNSDGENSGINAGRICWSIDKTPCKGENNDYRKCLECKFYEIVRKQESIDFEIVNPDLHIKYKEGEVNKWN